MTLPVPSAGTAAALVFGQTPHPAPTPPDDRPQDRFERLERRVRAALAAGQVLVDAQGRPAVSQWAGLCAGLRPHEVLISLPAVLRRLNDIPAIAGPAAEDPLWPDRLAVLLASKLKAAHQSVAPEAADGLIRRLADLEAENFRLRAAVEQLSDVALAVEAARDEATSKMAAIRAVLAEVLESAALADELRRMIHTQAMAALAAPIPPITMPQPAVMPAAVA